MRIICFFLEHFRLERSKVKVIQKIQRTFLQEQPKRAARTHHKINIQIARPIISQIRRANDRVLCPYNTHQFSRLRMSNPQLPYDYLYLALIYQGTSYIVCKRFFRVI